VHRVGAPPPCHIPARQDSVHRKPPLTPGASARELCGAGVLLADRISGPVARARCRPDGARGKKHLALTHCLRSFAPRCPSSSRAAARHAHHHAERRPLRRDLPAGLEGVLPGGPGQRDHGLAAGGPPAAFTQALGTWIAGLAILAKDQDARIRLRIRPRQTNRVLRRSLVDRHVIVPTPPTEQAWRFIAELTPA
jgi:hypothetical protein